MLKATKKGRGRNFSVSSSLKLALQSCSDPLSDVEVESIEVRASDSNAERGLATATSDDDNRVSVSRIISKTKKIKAVFDISMDQEVIP